MPLTMRVELRDVNGRPFCPPSAARSSIDWPRNPMLEARAVA
jgi:hypothetical protein